MREGITVEDETAVFEAPGVLDSEELVALAKLDMANGNLGQALYKIKRVLQSKTINAAALSIGGKIYAQLGLFAKAKSCLEQFLELNPDSVVERFQYGMVHFDEGKADKAVQLWNELLASHPTHPPALFYKALALAQSNRLADARASLAILLQSAPAENLYFGRGKELLQTMEAGANVQRAGDFGDKDDANSKKTLIKDAYKVIN